MKCPWILALVSALPLHAIAAEPKDPADEYTAEWSRKCDQLLEEWRKPGAAHDAESRETLIESAVKAERPAIIEEVVAGGEVGKIEIKLPADIRTIAAQRLRTLTPPPIDRSQQKLPWVIRRMTKTHFEVWTPKHGWLFNAKGKLVAEASPPRHDGIGREWYGSFLPDGRWVTTDLWEYDKTLTLFSARGKFLKEMPATQLAPPKTDQDNFSQDLIGWARCDSHGEGWVVSIGSDGGRAIVLVTPEGKARELTEPGEPWDLCYPRDLEPKGTYISLQRPSDDGKRMIEFGEAGHGQWVGFPHYNWRKDSDEARDGKVIPEGDHNFGFLPGSHDVFIGASSWESEEDAMRADEPAEGRAQPKTWFFGAQGDCRGWVRGSYLADSADGQAMWFRDEQGRVVTLDHDLHPQSRLRFVIDGAKATPHKIFPDLRLGFFRVKGKLALARW